MEAIQYVEHWRKRKIASRMLPQIRHQNRFKVISQLCLGKTAIDIGCADGDSTFYLSNLYSSAKWIGLDFAKTFVDGAKSNTKFKNIDWVFSPNYDLFSVLKRKIDTVVCSEVIEHVKEDRLFVENLWKITDKILIITTPNIKVNDPGHLRVYNENTLKKLFEGIPYNVFSNDIFYYITCIKKPKETKTEEKKKNNSLHIWKKVHEKNLIKKKANINNFVVITSYFNPQRSQNRYQNFLKFSQHMADLKIPLYTIEGHYYKDEPQLTQKDCQNLYTIEYYDILWQKERLLNILVDKLPPEVDCFGWFDADIIFPCDNLKEQCEETLRYYPVMQPWSTCHFLDKDGNTLQDFYSMSSKNFLREDKIVEQRREHPGFAWCIRRDEFVKMGNFYDIMICGNGDTFMAMAFFNHLNYPFMQQEKINLPTSQHFIRWWKQSSKVINSQVGFLDIEINHLYHGTRQNRRYWERVKNLFDNGFNPDIHLEYAKNKTYKFSDNTPAVIKNYLEDLLLNQRRDDE